MSAVAVTSAATGLAPTAAMPVSLLAAVSDAIPPSAPMTLSTADAIGESAIVTAVQTHGSRALVEVYGPYAPACAPGMISAVACPQLVVSSSITLVREINPGAKGPTPPVAAFP